ncbi:MAG: fumarate hydratase [Chitinophagaceae bacterium]|nr:MAG: fumarate hydratase [Chitinophagaceae bacterium]
MDMIFCRRFYVLLITLNLILLTACTRLPNVQGNGEAVLQGIWNQDSVANADKLLNYTQHKFKFSCDSFYVDLTTHSKVNYYEEACFNNGVWKEYAKGTYAVSGDTLFLKGTFTKANYKQKVSGCYRNGQYISNFKLKSIRANELVIESLNDQKESLLVLKEKINCVPKEL